MHGSVTLHMDAPPEEVWALVAGVTRTGELSPETLACEWLDGATGPAEGVRFRGHVKRNGRGPMYWTVCRIDTCEVGEELAYTVMMGDRRVNTWSYRLRPVTGGTDVTESFSLADNPVVKGYWRLFGRARGRTNERNMRTTLERMKAVVEASGPGTAVNARTGDDTRPEPEAIPRSYETGPSEPVRLADEPGTSVDVDIDAPPDRVWDRVVDLDLPARFSDELLGATWDDPATPPAVGARFTGRNTHPAIGEWEVPCYVDAYEQRRVFGWRTSDEDHPGARWRFELSPVDQATRLRFSLTMGPGPSGLTPAIAARPDKEDRIIARRLGEHHANMTRVVEGIRAAAEAEPG